VKILVDLWILQNRVMKKILGCLFVLISCQGLGQNAVKLSFSGECSSEDISYMTDVMNELNGGALFKNDVKLFCENLFMESSVLFKNEYLNFEVLQNTKYKSIGELLLAVQARSSKDKILVLIKDNEIIPSGLDGIDVYYDVKSLKRSVKTNLKAGRNSNVVYYNGFFPYVFSSARLNQAFDEKGARNLIPSFVDLEEYFQLRPTSAMYEITLDSIGYFDQYEIEIYRYLQNGGKKILLNERLGFESVSATGVSINYTGINRSCVIRVPEIPLGRLCVSTFATSNDEIPTEEEECLQCAQECLYRRDFEIRIRGVASGLTYDEIWSTPIKHIQFQCAKWKI
jgi:hypothetical protein